MLRAILMFLLLLPAPLARAQSSVQSSDCLAMAMNAPPLMHATYTPVALKQNEAQLTYVGHSTFIIESAAGIKIATDYAGWAGGIVPDAVTMNRAHRTHYTDTPDPEIKHVLRGWSADGSPVHHDLSLGDVRIRNVTTDIRGVQVGRVPNGNSIFIFEVAGLCIGHLGHLHHELTPEHLGWIGRLDVVMVPVDGGYTMAQPNMFRVLKDLKARLVIPMHYFGPDTLARFLDYARADYEVTFAESSVLVVSPETLPAKPKLVVLPGG